MTAALVVISLAELAVLAVLANRLKGLVGWAEREQQNATQYRGAALLALEDRVALAAALWELEQARKRGGLIVAGSERQDAQAETDFRAAVEQFSHPTIVRNGSDST